MTTKSSAGCVAISSARPYLRSQLAEPAQDADNNTILHLLASIPSPPTLSPHIHLISSSSFPIRPSDKSTSEQIETCLRMTNLYQTVFPFVLDWSNSGGKTALHVAAQAGNSQFINCLCDYGADVDLTDLQGNAPLHYASAWGHVDTIKLLLERGCQFATRNVDGFTAADFAYSHTVKATLETTAKELFEGRRNRRMAEMVPSTSGSSSKFISPPMPEGRLRSGSVSTNLSGGSKVSHNPTFPSSLGPRRPSAGTVSSSQAGSQYLQMQQPSPQVSLRDYTASPRKQPSKSPSPMSRRESEPATTRAQALQQLAPQSIGTPLAAPPPERPTSQTSQGRPSPARSPSLPSYTSSSVFKFTPAPPLPPLPGPNISNTVNTSMGTGTAPGPPVLGAALPGRSAASRGSIDATSGSMQGTPMRRANSSQTASSTSSGHMEGLRMPTPPRKPGPGPANRGTPI